MAISDGTFVLTEVATGGREDEPSEPAQTTKVDQLAAWVLRSQREDLAADAAEALKLRLLDALGCGIAALDGRPPELVRGVVEQAGGAPQATLIGGGKNALDRVTLYNGSLVRYLDFTDGFLTRGETCHPSDNLSPILAASEYANLGGRDFLHALAIGYEIQCRMAEEGPLLPSGLDHTSYLTFSVPAAVSRVLGLSEARTAHAIAIGGSDLEGLSVIRASPSCHWTGLASASVAASAVTATLLAARGVEGPLRLFEGPGGLEELASHRIHLDWSDPSLNRVVRTVVKPYDAEVHTQATISAALVLREENRLERSDAADIESVEVETFLAAYDMTGGGRMGDRHAVHAREQADQSIPYLVAVALLDGEVGPFQLEPARIERADVQALIQRVRVRTPSHLTRPRAVAEHLDSFTRHYPEQVEARVTVRLSGDRTYSTVVEDHEGFPTRPMSRERVEEKFHALASPFADLGLRKDLVQAALGVESLPRIGELGTLLGRAGRGQVRRGAG
jgi:2-methylcitrate dehydratase